MINIDKVQFEKLFEPGWIGQMKLKNRIVMPPMVTNFTREDRSVSERMKDYYEARAKGGVGLVIVEASSVEHSLGARGHGQMYIDDDKFIPGLSELAQVIHKHGAKAAIQIHHAGRLSDCPLQPVAPSPLASKGGRIPRELTIEEIQDLVSRFAQAAARAKKAGFDGVELHGARGYLIAEFLSAASNKRVDKYGGNVSNRTRFLVEIIRACKKEVGQNYPVWCRINGREFGIEEGISLDESRQIARLAQDAGCDAIHVMSSAEGLSTVPVGVTSRIPSMAAPVGHDAWLATGIKKHIRVPVIAVGRITPEFGERLLREEKTDFIAIGKALLVDPDWANKVASGNVEDIRPCISCMSCLRALMQGVDSPDYSVRCAVNATLGKEKEFAIQPAGRAKKILIIGGGAAGLEAARVAALRGHHVVLWEKDNYLAGQLNIASLPPFKQIIQSLNIHLEQQVKKLGVTIELNKKADVSQVEELNPDVIILATGASPIMPEIPGIKRASVAFPQDVLMEKVSVGVKVIVIGGALVGCEIADFLSERGKNVTITRRGPEIGAEVPSPDREILLDRLNIKGVTMLTGVKYQEAVDDGLLITTKEEEKRIIKADTLVLTSGYRPNRELFEVLKNKGYEIYTVGDCVKPRRILDAIHDGYAVGHAI